MRGLQELQQGLTLDSDGVLLLDGLRTVILPAFFLVELQDGAEKLMGRGAFGILHRTGEEFGRRVAEVTRKSLGTEDAAAVFRRIQVRTETRGFGRAEAVRFDPGTGEALLCMERSPMVEEAGTRSHRTCYFAAGFWTGVVGVLTGLAVTGEERLCRSKGDDRCEFVIGPLPRTSP